MPARLLFFGSLRAFSLEFERAPADAETLKALRAWIAARSPKLAESLGSVKLRIAVDGEIVQDDNVNISAAREIAFLPPMSGG
jgi:molybdopterin converting factor small subunit